MRNRLPKTLKGGIILAFLIWPIGILLNDLFFAYVYRPDKLYHWRVSAFRTSQAIAFFLSLSIWTTAIWKTQKPTWPHKILASLSGVPIFTIWAFLCEFAVYGFLLLNRNF